MPVSGVRFLVAVASHQLHAAAAAVASNDSPFPIPDSQRASPQRPSGPEGFRDGDLVGGAGAGAQQRYGGAAL